MINQKLIGELIGLARATEGNEHLINSSSTAAIVVCLSANADISEEMLHELLDRVDAEKRRMVPDCYLCASPCGKNNAFDVNRLQSASTEFRNAKLTILHGICELARSGGPHNREEELLLYHALILIGIEEPSEATLRLYQTRIQKYIR